MTPQLLEALQSAFNSAVAQILDRHPDWKDSDSLPPLLHEDRKIFDELFAKFRCRKVFNQVSTDGLRRRLENAVVDALASDANSNAVAERLALQLETAMRCEVILPMQGIDLRHIQLDLSGDVTATFIAEETYEDLVVRPYERAAALRDQPADVGRRVAEWLRPRISNQSVLRIMADGDENVALWAAEKRADLAVDALQFVACISESEDWHYQVDWRGRIAPMAWRSTAIIPREGHVLAQNPAQRTGPMTLWGPRPDAVDHLKEHGGWKLAMLPLKTKTTVHEDRLARAIRAVAAAGRAVTTDEKKLAYVSVFDIFFSIPGGDVARSVREGVAFTMWPVDNSAHDAQRLELAQFIDRVYASRSITSHEFQIGIFEPSDLSRLREVAVHFIAAMCDQPFTQEDKSDIMAWLQRCREALGAERYEPYNAMSREPIQIDTNA